MRTNTLYFAALMAMAPAALAAQDSASSAAGSATTASARLDATLEAAVDAGIPVSLLERKVAEGRAKGVPMERIAAAVEARLSALTRAREAMIEGGLTSTTEGELSVAADAVQAGVSGSALATISRTASDERRAVAIAVLSELVTSGQTAEQAVARVQAALSAGGEALANLRTGGAVGAGAGVGAGVGTRGVQVDAAGGARVDLGGRVN